MGRYGEYPAHNPAVPCCVVPCHAMLRGQAQPQPKKVAATSNSASGTVCSSDTASASETSSTF